MKALPTPAVTTVMRDMTTEERIVIARQVRWEAQARLDEENAKEQKARLDRIIEKPVVDPHDEEAFQAAIAKLEARLKAAEARPIAAPIPVFMHEPMGLFGQPMVQPIFGPGIVGRGVVQRPVIRRVGRSGVTIRRRGER